MGNNKNHNKVTFKKISFKERASILFTSMLIAQAVVGSLLIISFLKNQSSLASLILLVFCLTLLATLTIIIWNFINRRMLLPLQTITRAVNQLVAGEWNDHLNGKAENEIMGLQMQINSLADQIRFAQRFAKKIGKGELDAENKEDELMEKNGNGLLNDLLLMKNTLHKLGEDENKRNWVTNGMAEFTIILRSNDTDLSSLCKRIITALVRYLNASQGALYVINNDHPEEQYLELIAGYAFHESMEIEKKVLVHEDYAEGLIGQSFLGNETIHLKNIPKDFLKISSGLGDATPRNVLILPIELNGKPEGVIELASFHPFEKRQVEFAERVSENIASAILTIKVNDHTKKLLREAQEMTLKLQTREEELRQNYEELQATQEQMMVTQAELDGQLNAINNSSIAKVEYSLDEKVQSANESFIFLTGYTKEDLSQLHHRDFTFSNFADEESYALFWDRLKNGKAQIGEFRLFSKNQQSVWVNSVYSPVINRKGEVFKIVQLSFDITDAKLKAKEIESKNSLITSSIQYAQNIQRAILPSEDVIKAYIADFFVIYLPKDIVSGDFYWFSHINNKTFFASVDCTGHGVPGAFMSIIGNTLLNEIINVQQIHDPAEVLRLMHLGVRTKLRQNENSNYDGMDLTICVLEEKEGNEFELTFSAAKRSMFYFKNNELKELKGDRKTIGGWQSEENRAFSKSQVTLHKGDAIYLFTDGIVDNPDAKRKKFGSRRFEKMLRENYTLPLIEQKELLLHAIADHQEGSEQRDDITVMGIKL